MVNILNSSLKEANDHIEKRQQKQFKNIIKCLSKSDSAFTIPDIAEYVKISVPTCTKLVRTLVDKKYLVEEGKKETENGRRPEFYALNKRRFYAIGVEILHKFMSDKTGQTVKKLEKDMDRDYWLSAQESVDYGIVDKILKI